MFYSMRNARTRTSRLVAAIVVMAAGFAPSAMAAAPGIRSTVGTTEAPTAVFNLVASDGYTSQPDGAQIYTWGYGCDPTATPFNPRFAPRPMPGQTCGAMQLPGPTLVVPEGTRVVIRLRNALPVGAGNTSMLFPGFDVTSSGGAVGRLTQEATQSSVVTYRFTAGKPGTYAYYSGTQGDLQIEMGLFGAIIVTPTSHSGCATTKNPYSVSTAAYDDAAPGTNLTCYDREFLFQFSEMDSEIHTAAEAQKGSTTPIVVSTEPYNANYYLINGRSMPDDMDSQYAPGYPNQPYNANPQVHPGERLLMRMIGQGRWQHPFHFHANHARVLARDANPLLASSNAAKLAGPLLFTSSNVPGQTVDALFMWTGVGLNWDAYGPASAIHSTCNGVTYSAAAANLSVPNPMASPVGLQLNGSLSGSPFDATTHEYCPDHAKPIPATLPDPQLLANGAWYSGSPYLGVQGSVTNNLPPGTLELNASGYAYMWHSHNEREITTNDVFPGGIMTMLIIQPLNVTIIESN